MKQAYCRIIQISNPENYLDLQSVISVITFNYNHLENELEFLFKKMSEGKVAKRKNINQRTEPKRSKTLYDIIYMWNLKNTTKE